MINKEGKLNNINKLKTFNRFCCICDKTNNGIEKAIPCYTCKSLIHRKCSKLGINYIEYKLNCETYMCQICNDNTFPFNKLITIDDETFNSNFFNNSMKHEQNIIDSENFKDQILNLKKLTFNKNSYHANFDPDEEIKDNSNFSYYTTKEFHKLRDRIKEDKKFSLIHSNIQSLNCNFDKLEYLIKEVDHQFDVIAVTETWNDENNKHQFQPGILDNYYPYEGITGSSSKGGCGFYINKSITYIPRDDLDIRYKDNKNEFEGKWIEIVNEKMNKNIIIGVNYRHPRNSDLEYIKYLNNTFKKIKKENKKIILTGDFNYNLMKHETKKDVSEFINLMFSNLMQPHILGPSRMRVGSRPSLIDNIYLNDIEIECTSGNLYGKISDHMPNFLIMGNVEYSNNKQEKIIIRDMSNFDRFKFIKDIKVDDLMKTINEKNDVNDQYNILHSELIRIIDKNIPLKILTQKEKKSKMKPWITRGIRKSINRKNKLYKTYIETKNEDIYKEYRKLRNKLSHIIRASKMKHYNKYFEDNKFNAKKMWGGINEIINMKSKRKNSNIHLQINNKIITDPKDVGNHFNEYFSSIAQKMFGKQKVQKDASIFLKNRIQNSFFITPTTEEEVSDIIKGLSDNKSSDIYGYSVKLIKIALPKIANILSYIFNNSFSQGKFPDKLKCASITPIHKEGSKLLLSNYRPISILPLFSKILEKIMQVRLVSYLNKYNIIYEHQYGFQENKSTSLAIMDMYSNLIKAIDGKQYSCGVFLDFSKAFDTVNHDLLIEKIEHYGIRGIASEWFKSYLSNRYQKVKIGNTMSQECKIVCGVPQGSVLGPILFLLYINDIQHSSDILKFHLFADDTSTIYSHEDLKYIEKIYNKELAKVSEWLRINKLTLNVLKSKVVVFHPKHKKNKANY